MQIWQCLRISSSTHLDKTLFRPYAILCYINGTNLIDMQLELENELKSDKRIKDISISFGKLI